VETKPWYWSSFVWLGVVETVIGALELVATYLENGDFTPTALVLLVAGIFTVIRRVWGTPAKLV
jgi:hypothetical protein